MMSRNLNSYFRSSDGSVVLNIQFAPAPSPGDDGSLTITVTDGTLTVSGVDDAGITGTCSLQQDQNTDPANTSTTYTGTFDFASSADATTSLSGTVTGFVDSNNGFWAKRFTDVALSSSSFDVPAGFNQILQPAPPKVGGTASAIIKPSAS